MTKKLQPGYSTSSDREGSQKEFWEVSWEEQGKKAQLKLKNFKS